MQRSSVACRACLMLVVASWCLASALAEEPNKSSEPSNPAYTPTSEYRQQDVLGWKVYFHPELVGREQLFAQVRDVLQNQLFKVTRALPEAPLAQVRKIPIWVEYFHPKTACACYHVDRGWVTSNGLNPEKTKCVEIGNAKNFVEWTHAQPWMMLHELAHGYHDQFLPEGHSNPTIRETFERAKAGGQYEEVLRYSGKKERHYALTNPMEYFAETTEAYFGTNDFYPFIRAELTTFDPAGADMIEQVWGLREASAAGR